MPQMVYKKDNYRFRSATWN